MSLLSDYNLRNNEVFLRRVASAIAKAATDVRAEDPQTQNHANRITWANRLTSTPQIQEEAQKMIISIAANASISGAFEGSEDNPASIPDGDIQFVVNSLVDTYAP